MPDNEPRNPMQAFSNAVFSMVDGPVTWFRGKILLKNVIVGKFC